MYELLTVGLPYCVT